MSTLHCVGKNNLALTLVSDTYVPILEEWNGVIAHLDVIIRYDSYVFIGSMLVFIIV